MRCLQLLFERQSRDFAPFITDELMMSVFKASDHHNRFVREAAFALCSSLCFCEAEGGTSAVSILLTSKFAISLPFRFNRSYPWGIRISTLFTNK